MIVALLLIIVAVLLCGSSAVIGFIGIVLGCIAGAVGFIMFALSFGETGIYILLCGMMFAGIGGAIYQMMPSLAAPKKLSAHELIEKRAADQAAWLDSLKDK